MQNLLSDSTLMAKYTHLNFNEFNIQCWFYTCTDKSMSNEPHQQKYKKLRLEVHGNTF